MTPARLLRTLGACAGAWVIGAAAAAAAVPEQGPAWSKLSAAQQQALAPLQRDWPSIEPNRKQKWLELATRFPNMPADERQRVQERMAEWARLTPAERTRARLQFKEARQVPADERQAKWQAYQALPEDERKQLAQRAKPAAKPASAPDLTGRSHAAAASSAGERKAPATAPMVVQAKPGATTTTMTVKPHKPNPAQPGAPKIAATAGYVDPATLLPKRTAPAAAPPQSPTPQ